MKEGSFFYSLLNGISRLLVKICYPRIYTPRPIDIAGTVLFQQKFCRKNGSIPWPVHPASKVLHRKNITVGRRSFPGFSHGCYIQGRNGIVIGDNLRMGPGVGLISANHSEDDYDVWEESSPLTIGDNVWIGMNAVILPGVSIGSNAVIGAGSVVTHDIPANSVAAGNPCKVIREKKPYSGFDYGKK